MINSRFGWAVPGFIYVLSSIREFDKSIRDWIIYTRQVLSLRELISKLDLLDLLDLLGVLGVLGVLDLRLNVVIFIDYRYF